MIPGIRSSADVANGRRGSVLLLITGIVAMLAMLAMVFLARMRTDAQEIGALVQVTQCRLMLHAGMAFIQEQSRLGYAIMAPDGTTSDPREAWGWIDTRPMDNPPGAGQAEFTPPSGALPDGQRYMLGPRGRDKRPLWTAGAWPDLGTSIRCPMHRAQRPPWAVQPLIAANAMGSDPADPATFGIPVLARPDPLPALDRAVYPLLPAPSDPTAPVARSAWAVGDRTPVQRSTGHSWFRVYRENGSEPDRPAKAGPIGATFIITVGSGGSRGYKDWNEMTSAQQSQEFQGMQSLFDEILAGEMRQWFRVEWSAAVSGGETRLYHEAFTSGDRSSRESSFLAHLPVNASRHRNNQISAHWDAQNNASTMDPRNYIGTIRYIERIDVRPSAW